MIFLQTPNTQSLWGKWRHWWILAQTLATCACQLRSLSICTPKYLYEVTCLMTWPHMATRLPSPADLGSSNISTVLHVLIYSWWTSHQSTNLPTATLWLHGLELLVSKLRMTVSSENVPTCRLGWELTQSLVYRVNKKGEVTPVWPQCCFLPCQTELNFSCCGQFERKEWDHLIKKGFTSNWSSFLKRMCGWIDQIKSSLTHAAGGFICFYISTSSVLLIEKN